MNLRLIPLAFFAAVGFLSAAEPVSVDSKITAATVFLDRAEITRVAEFEAPPGGGSFRFDDLPASINGGSLRLEGTGGFTLVDLKHNSRLVTEEPRERLRELEEERETLERSLRTEEGLIRRLDGEASFVHAVAARFTTVPKEGPAPEPSPQTWRDLLAFQQEELARVDGARLEAEARVRDLKEELRRVMDEIGNLGRGREKRVHFADARIEKATAGPVRLELRYVVYGAGWSPAYDLRVDSEGEAIELTYFGEVRQSTGEDWQGVELRLSTAKPMIGGRPPELRPWFLRYLEGMPRSAFQAGLEEKLAYAEPAMADSVGQLAPMEMRETTVETGATASTFAIALPADVPADSSRSRVVLKQASFPAEFHYTAVPKLSPFAYLEAIATNSTDFPLLPGTASVFLDGSFVAETGLDMISPAEEFQVALGIDEGIKVERRMVEDLADKTGIIRNKKKLRFAYRFEITNNKPRVIELLLRDQLPKSTDDSLKVELVDPRINPADTSIILDDQGFIEWTFAIKPGRETAARLEYTVEFPEDKTVLGLP